MALRPDSFSYEGLSALFEMFEQMEEDTGIEVELDVIAICCDYSEYSSALEAAIEYGFDGEDEDDDADEVEEKALEWLNDQTTVYPFDRGIIVSREYRLADEPDKPISEAQVGDVIQVRLTIIAPNDLHYVVVEDPLPAGCEALDPSLQITSVTIEPPKLEREPDNKTPWWMRWWFGWWSPTHTELRDEKVALFATYMPRGTYQYTYMMRASLPGQFMVIPTTAYEMYFPEVFGRAEGKLFDIRR